MTDNDSLADIEITQLALKRLRMLARQRDSMRRLRAERKQGQKKLC